MRAVLSVLVSILCAVALVSCSLGGADKNSSVMSNVNEDTPPPGSLDPNIIRQSLEAKGFTNVGVPVFKRGSYWGVATNPSGLNMQLRLNPLTGTVLEEN